MSINKIKLIDYSKPITSKIEIKTKEKWKIDELVSGKIGSTVFLAEELEDLAITFGSIHLQNIDSIESIKLLRLPNYDDKIIFVFDDKYESSEFHLRICSTKPSEDKRKVILEFFGFEMELNLEFLPNQSISINSSINPKGDLDTVRDGIEFYEIMTRVMSEVQFTAYKNNEKKYRHADNFQLNMTEGNFEAMLEHFKNLKRIEQFFEIRFTNLKLEHEVFSKAEDIMAYIEKGFIVETFDKSKFEIGESDFNTIKGEKGDFLLLYAENERTVYNLHNHKIDVGFSFILIPETFIEKEDEAQEQIIIRSRSKKLYRGFSDEQEVKIEEFQVKIND